VQGQESSYNFHRIFLVSRGGREARHVQARDKLDSATCLDRSLVFPQQLQQCVSIGVYDISEVANAAPHSSRFCLHIPVFLAVPAHGREYPREKD